MTADKEMMSEIAAAQTEVIEEFEFLGDWMARYQYIIDLGRQLPPFPEALKTEANKIKGCQSQVWFDADIKDGRLSLRAVSDAAIVSGLIAILLRIYDGRQPADILSADDQFVSQLGLEQHLSPTRSNGLAAMLKAIRGFAEDASACTAKH